MSVQQQDTRPRVVGETTADTNFHLMRIADALERIAAVMEADQKWSLQIAQAEHARLKSEYQSACDEFERYERALDAALRNGNQEGAGIASKRSANAEDRALSAEAALREFEAAHPELVATDD